MSARIRNTVFAVLPLLVVVGSAEAWADDAKESFDRGVELYNEQDYPGALAEFLAAYKAKPHHGVLYNIAQCYQMIDAGADALSYYRLYLEEGADYIKDSRRELVESEIAKLEEQLTPLTLVVEPDGATVLLDGKSLGESPVELRYLDPGEHTIMVQKPGWETQQESFVAKRGVPVEIAVELEKDGSTTDPPDGEDVAEARVHWGAPVATGVLTLASGVAAIVLGVLNSQHHDEFLSLRGSIEDGTYAGSDAEKAYDDSRDEGDALNAGVAVTIGLTAAFAVVTAVLVPLAIPKKKVEVQALGPGLSLKLSF